LPDMCDPAVVPAFADPPESGVPFEVAEGVLWLRMPIPIPGLEFINLWLLRDGDGWTVVDTGISSRTVRAHWEEVFERHLDGRPIRRVICTHFHPDHVGLAGWLAERWDAPLWMTFSEWSFGRMLQLDAAEDVPDEIVAFYHRAGFDAAMLEAFRGHGFSNFRRAVHDIPRQLRRLGDGDELEIGGERWRVMVGRGHSPEHACLHCARLGVLLSGDQILPRISPHIGVYPGEPEADPLAAYLDSLARFRSLPAETLVLPAHDGPFTGFHARLAELAAHHDARLGEIERACREPRTVVELLPILFKRPLDAFGHVLGTAEGLAHLHYLMGRGRVMREPTADGVYRYRRCVTAARAGADAA